MQNIENEIQLMLSARFPLLWVVSPEEETAEEALCAVAIAKKAQIYFWDFARGFSDSGAAKGNPMQALDRVSKGSPEVPAIFVMKDLATLIAPGANGQISPSQLPIAREIKNLAREIARDRRTRQRTVADIPNYSIDRHEKLIDTIADETGNLSKIGQPIKNHGLSQQLRWSRI